MNKKIKIASIILIIIISILSVSKEFQNDTFYLIKVGETILTKGIDFKDHFSFHNLPYQYPHILFSIIVYIFYDLFSLTGLYILTIIFTIILAISMYYINIKNSKNQIMTTAFTLIFIIAINGFLTLRAQIVSYIIFIFEYYFLNKLITRNKIKYIIYIFLLAVLLVNTHVAVYPFYIIIFLPFLGEYILKKITKKETYKIKHLLISLFLSLTAGLFSPLFLNSYTYLFNTLINTTTNYITEHQPIILIKDIRMIICSLLIILLFTTKKFKLEIKEKLLLLGLTLMAFSSARHMSLLIIFLTIILSKYWSNYLLEKEQNQNKKIEKFFTSKRGIITLLIYLLFITIIVIPRNINKEYINKQDYPVEATKYIKENIDYKNIRIFNDYNIGSYLILNDIKVFIDSRSDLYTKSYNKKEDIFQDFINVNSINVYYEDIFDKYSIDYILINNNSSLSMLLLHDENYNTIYSDNYFILYKRNK